jgi:release factor glutamine methyltransferase
LPAEIAPLRSSALARTRREALGLASATLAGAGIDSARADAEWLLAGILGVGRAAVHLEPALPVAAAARYRSAVGRRARREPLQRILGWEEFAGLRFHLTDAVLIPRPETEVLADWACALLPPAAPGRRLTVVDVGTGSGCVAGALAWRRPDARVLALDVSLDAVEVTRDNIAALGLERRVHVAAADLLGPVRAGAVDLIVSNPPYLPTASLASLPPEVRDHDPALALDGGPDGLAVIRRLIFEARSRLAPAGTLVLETAGGPQAGAVAALLNEAGFRHVLVHNDLAGIQRFVAGRESPAAVCDTRAAEREPLAAGRQARAAERGPTAAGHRRSGAGRD